MAYYSDIGWPNIVEILTTHRGDVGILIFEEGNDIPLILAKSQSNVATANLLVSHHTNLGARSSRFIASYMAGARFCEGFAKLPINYCIDVKQSMQRQHYISPFLVEMRALSSCSMTIRSDIATGDEDG